MKTYSTTLLSLLFLLTGTITMQAQPGTLDATFGTGGKALTDVGPDYAYGDAMVIQSDGKIVVAGSSYQGGSKNDDFCVVRFNSNGTLDNSFDGDGKVTTDFKGLDDDAWEVALQADGKILLVGIVDSGTSTNCGIARYNTDGSLDNSFSGDGKAIIRIQAGTGFEGLYAVAVQSDGKILIVGGANGVTLVARLNSNGSLDMTFNGTGFLLFDFVSGGSAASAVIPQAGGKILVAGTAKVNTSFDFAVARLNSDGTFDASFSTDGKVTVAVNGDKNNAETMAVQADGKIVVAGNSQVGSSFLCAIMRLNSDGTLDNSFSSDGKLSHGVLADGAEIDHIAIQSDGKILAVGNSSLSTTTFSSLVRYNSDGSFDNSFGTSGKVTTTFGGTADFGGGVALQKDGKIIVAGSSDNGTSLSSVTVARYISGLTVSLDETFASDFSLKVYPNPFTDVVNLQYELNGASEVRIELYDMQGRLVVSDSKTLLSGPHTESIHIGSLPAGMYQLIVLTADSKQTMLLKH